MAEINLTKIVYVFITVRISLETLPTKGKLDKSNNNNWTINNSISSNNNNKIFNESIDMIKFTVKIIMEMIRIKFILQYSFYMILCYNFL